MQIHLFDSAATYNDYQLSPVRKWRTQKNTYNTKIVLVTDQWLWLAVLQSLLSESSDWSVSESLGKWPQFRDRPRDNGNSLTTTLWKLSVASSISSKWQKLERLMALFR